MRGSSLCVHLLSVAVGDGRLRLAVVLGTPAWCMALDSGNMVLLQLHGERSASGPTVGFAPEQHDVRLGPVDGVVHPAARLLHANATPFSLRKEHAGEAVGGVPAGACLPLQPRLSYLTSLSSLPLGSSCAISGGRTTCLARAWRGTVSGLRVRFKGQLQRFRPLPVLENVVIILLRVLNVVVRHGEHTRPLLEDARRCCYPQALPAADQRPARLRVMGT